MIGQIITQEILQIIVTNILPLVGLIIMIYLAILKWRESKANPYNIVLSLFFIFLILGLVFNALYALLVNEISEFYYILLARISAFCFSMAMIFPIFFLYALIKSFQGIERWKKAGFIVVFILLFLPLLWFGKIHLSETYVLTWDWTLAAYNFMLMGILLTLFVFYTKKVWDLFEDPLMKKRFLFFILGYLFISWMLISVVLVKLSLIPSLISVISVGFGILLAPTSIYQGIGKGKKT